MSEIIDPLPIAFRLMKHALHILDDCHPVAAAKLSEAIDALDMSDAITGDAGATVASH